MLEVDNALFVGPLLLFLMFTIARGCIGVAVRGRMGVKNTDIKKGAFGAASPEPISSNVQPRSVLGVSSCSIQLLACDWLKVGSRAHIVADF